MADWLWFASQTHTHTNTQTISRFLVADRSGFNGAEMYSCLLVVLELPVVSSWKLCAPQIVFRIGKLECKMGIDCMNMWLIKQSAHSNRKLTPFGLHCTALASWHYHCTGTILHTDGGGFDWASSVGTGKTESIFVWHSASVCVQARWSIDTSAVSRTNRAPVPVCRRSHDGINPFVHPFQLEQSHLVLCGSDFYPISLIANYTWCTHLHCLLSLS